MFPPTKTKRQETNFSKQTQKCPLGHTVSSSSPSLMLPIWANYQLPGAPFCRDKSYLDGMSLWGVPHGEGPRVSNAMGLKVLGDGDC